MSHGEHSHSTNIRSACQKREPIAIEPLGQGLPTDELLLPLSGAQTGRLLQKEPALHRNKTMSTSDRRREVQTEASTLGREWRTEARPSREEKGSFKESREGGLRLEKSENRSSKSRSPWEDRSTLGRLEPSRQHQGSSDPDLCQPEHRQSSRGEVSQHRERMEKRIRSEPSLREAGEISDDRHRDYAKRQRTEDRSHRSRSRHDGGGGREGTGGGIPLPRRRGEANPARPDQGGSAAGEDRRTPGKGERQGSATPSRMLAAIPAEIRKAALEAQKREQARLAAAAAAARSSDGETEERGQGVSSSSVQSKHTPIVWGGLGGAAGEPAGRSPLPPSRTVTRTAAEIAAMELEEFRAVQAGDIDPDAPAAMKASPSGSQNGSDDGEIKEPRPMEVDSAPLEDIVAPGQGIKSRWLIDEEEDDAIPLANGKGTSAAQEEAEIAVLNELEQKDLEVGREANGDAHEWSDDDDSISEFQATRREVNMLNACRKVDCFERLNRISEGTYGVVYRAKDKETGTICALKRIKMEKERDGFPLTSIREINILLSFHHKNIVDVSEVVVGDSLDQVFMVMEFMEHDLKGLMDEMTEPFTVAETKNLMKQLLEGMAYLHSNWVLHRDLKTSNILYNNRGQLKICDFGLARQYGSPLRPYTHNVVTLYYRAIELLLGCEQYSTAIDVWSLGCIMAELLTKKVLFQGTGELDQIDKIFKVLGSPTEETWPGYRKLRNAQTLKFRYQKKTLRDVMPTASKFDPNSGLTEAGFALLEKMLALDPKQRISAEDALKHQWFKEQPWPKDNALMPTYPTSKDGTSRSARPRINRHASPAQEISGPNLASRTAEIGLLFGK